MSMADAPSDYEVPEDQRDLVMHAYLVTAKGDELMASDAPPDESGPVHGMYVHFSLPDAAEAERVFNGLSDGGAHVRMICDASIPTYLLTHWARDRVRGPRISVEEAVRLQTSATAEVIGLSDRGVIAPGRRADLNVIDFENLRINFPTAVADLPAGGTRLLQSADGYVATVVNGRITRRNGADTGERPGRLVRA